uniref:Uncharacterized protein n=1 Tax=Arundo donax TaxID=35708 RepID=A0A0A8ZL42_ARUDO
MHPFLLWFYACIANWQACIVCTTYYCWTISGTVLDQLINWAHDNMT